MTRLKGIVAVIAISLSASLLAEIKELNTQRVDFTGSVGAGGVETGPGGGGAWGLRRFVLCVDGLKVLQTVGPVGGYGTGVAFNPAVSTIQLLEERDGKVVPVTCK